MLDLDIPQPLEVEIYYTICISVGRHNKKRCDDLKLEKKLETYSRYQSFNLSIFGVSVVDTYNVATQYLEYEETSRAFFFALVEERINDDLGSRPTRPPSKRTSVNVWQHISSKHAKKGDYRVVDALPTIKNSGVESAK